MTRSDASWCGDAEFGPRADDREVGLVVALGDEALADLAGDVRLGPADQPACRDLADDAVGGLRREAQQGDLVGVLRHPQLAQDERRGFERRAGEGPLESEQVHRHELVRDAQP